MFDNSKERVSRKGAKAQRKSLFFAPLRALRETSFSSNDGITHILRTISSRTDLCITARIPAWEPFSFKLLLGRSSGSWSFKNTIPKRANPGDMLSILELAGTDEMESECHDLIELHSSTAFSTSKSYLIASGWCWIYV